LRKGKKEVLARHRAVFTAAALADCRIDARWADSPALV
jgi:hypothetical protein